MNPEQPVNLDCRLLDELVDDADASSRQPGEADASPRMLPELTDDAGAPPAAKSTATGQAASPALKFRVIVRADLSRYSDIARYLEQSLGAAAVATLDEQIQNLIRTAIGAVGLHPEDVLLRTEGDSALLAFEQAETASRFAEALHRAAQDYNLGKTVDLAERHFRIGIDSGEIVLEGQTTKAGETLGFRFAGITVAHAVRLESACDTGEVLIASKTWAKLPEPMLDLYGAEETVPGKRDETFRVHRRKVVDPAPWDQSPAGTSEARVPKAAAPPLGSVSLPPTAELRHFLTESLGMTEVRQLWYDTLDESLDAQMPHRPQAECVVELLTRARQRGRLGRLHDALRRIRPDLDLPDSF
jgi:class 3 adenylate cyclase